MLRALGIMGATSTGTGTPVVDRQLTPGAGSRQRAPEPSRP
jgi:hypothetical protein